MLAGRTTHIDESFGDILDNLDIGFMGVGEARYERFGVFTDLVYVRLSDSGDTPFGILANSVDFTTKSLMWTAAGEYRLLDQPDASVDAFAGFRLFSIENELDFNPPGLLGGLELSQTETWADPIVGLKGRLSDHPANLSDELGPDRRRRLVRPGMGCDGRRRLSVHRDVLGGDRLPRRGRRLLE